MGAHGNTTSPAISLEPPAAATDPDQNGPCPARTDLDPQTDSFLLVLMLQEQPAETATWPLADCLHELALYFYTCFSSHPFFWRALGLLSKERISLFKTPTCHDLYQEETRSRTTLMRGNLLHCKKPTFKNRRKIYWNEANWSANRTKKWSLSRLPKAHFCIRDFSQYFEIYS